MMPGNVLLRTVRVEQAVSTDESVLANRARDKFISMLNEERMRKVDTQRAGLSLAPLFSKPRPICEKEQNLLARHETPPCMQLSPGRIDCSGLTRNCTGPGSTPALVGTFGDAFIEGTGLDGQSCL